VTTQPHLRWNVAADIRELFAYHFMQNALLAGTIVAVLAAVIGWFMVLRSQTFAGHTLSVLGFPGAAAALWLGLSAATGYFAFGIAAALILAAVPRGASGLARRDESAVIGVVQAFALALGLLFVSLYKGFLGGVNSLLFGSFLGVTDSQVLTLLVFAIAALTVLAVIGRPLLFASVDADVATARGVPTRLLSTVFLLLLAITTAEVSQITGALLVFALLVMPAAAAQRLTVNPRLSLVLAVAIGALVTWLGLAVAYFSVYPIGFYITSLGFGAYLLATGWQAWRSRQGRRERRAGLGTALPVAGA
jgi:zinc/manganese transport system permease protein